MIPADDLNADKATKPVFLYDRYRAVRTQIEHEERQIIQRLSWLIASQAFLYAAYGNVLKAIQNDMQAAVMKQSMLTLNMIPLAAGGSGFLIYLSILGSWWTLLKLAKRARVLTPEAEANGLPPLICSQTSLWLSYAAILLVPPLFMASWAILFSCGQSCSAH